MQPAEGSWYLPAVRRWTSAVLLLAAACAQETVAHQQVERQANRILVILREEGIEAAKVTDETSRDLRFKVLVPAADFARSLDVLEEHNMPETPRTTTGDVFGSGGMIPTSQQERAKQIVGIEGDIVNALRKVPRVVEVEAAVSVPEPDPLRDVTEARPKPKASVLVVYRPDESRLPPISREEVQKFVQAKLPEITSKEVSVLLMAQDSQSQPAPTDEPVLTNTPALDPEISCEKDQVLGLEICVGNRRRFYNMVLGAGVVAMVLAGLLIFMVLRAMQYRRDLTRLTAQFERVKK